MKFQSIISAVQGLLDRAEAVLQGEPARFIGYGAAIVIVGVVGVSNALGVTRFGADISLTDALVDAGAASTFVITAIESIRHFVSPVASIPAPASDTDVAEQGNG